MKLPKKHISWKVLPVGEKRLLQVVCQINGGRVKFTENPDKPACELSLAIPPTNNYALIILPPCSLETIRYAKTLVEKVLVVDYNEVRLKEFMAKSSVQCEWLLVTDKDDFREKIGPFAQLLSFGQVASYVPTRYGKLDPQIKFLLSDQLLEIQKEFCSFAVNRTLKRWHRNLNTMENVSNLKSLVLQLPDSGQQDVVIVGAGPSLDMTVGKLEKRQGRCLIVATDGALKTLLKNGVKPDYIVSCEDSLMSWQFFVDCLDELKGIPLVAAHNANHYLLKHYPGAVCLVRDRYIEEWAHPLLANIPLIATGRCVGHLAFNLALHLNAGRIIMTGFDLAFKGESFHPVDMAVPYFHEMDLPVPVTVESIYGTKLKTDLSMVTYLKDFERMIATTEVEVIDATEGGARKRGALVKSFAEIDFQKDKSSTRCEVVEVSFLPEFHRLYSGSVSFKNHLVTGFTSYLVQNSAALTGSDKSDDLVSADHLLKALVKPKSKGRKRALVLCESQSYDSDLVNNFIGELPVIRYESLADLLLKVRDAKIGHIYCFDGQVPPDLVALDDLYCTDIKTSHEKQAHERALWLQKYSIVCSVEFYDFWRQNSPKWVRIETLTSVNSAQQVS